MKALHTDPHGRVLVDRSPVTTTAGFVTQHTYGFKTVSSAYETNRNPYNQDFRRFYKLTA